MKYFLGEHDLGNDESVERCCEAENNYRCALGHYPGKNFSNEKTSAQLNKLFKFSKIKSCIYLNPFHFR